LFEQPLFPPSFYCPSRLHVEVGQFPSRRVWLYSFILPGLLFCPCSFSIDPLRLFGRVSGQNPFCDLVKGRWQLTDFFRLRCVFRSSMGQLHSLLAYFWPKCSSLTQVYMFRHCFSPFFILIRVMMDTNLKEPNNCPSPFHFILTYCMDGGPSTPPLHNLLMTTHYLYRRIPVPSPLANLLGDVFLLSSGILALYHPQTPCWRVRLGLFPQRCTFLNHMRGYNTFYTQQAGHTADPFSTVPLRLSDFLMVPRSITILCMNFPTFLFAGFSWRDTADGHPAPCLQVFQPLPLNKDHTTTTFDCFLLAFRLLPLCQRTRFVIFFNVGAQPRNSILGPGRARSSPFCL